MLQAVLQRPMQAGIGEAQRLIEVIPVIGGVQLHKIQPAQTRIFDKGAHDLPGEPAPAMLGHREHVEHRSYLAVGKARVGRLLRDKHEGEAHDRAIVAARGEGEEVLSKMALAILSSMS